MSKFAELFEQLNGFNDENPMPENFYQDLAAAHEKEIEAREAKISQLETNNSAQLEKINEYARDNYELSKRAPVNTDNMGLATPPPVPGAGATEPLSLNKLLAPFEL